MSDALDPSLPFRLTITSGASDASNGSSPRRYPRRRRGASRTRASSPASTRCGSAATGPSRPRRRRGHDGRRSARGARRGRTGGRLHSPRAEPHRCEPVAGSRAASCARVLAEHPYVLVIEDDHFAMLSHAPVPLAHRARASTLGAGAVGVEVPRTRHVPRGRGIRSPHGGAARDAPDTRDDVGEPPAAAPDPRARDRS